MKFGDKSYWGTYIGKLPRWKCGFFFTGWTEISLGINLGLDGPNAELHVPFGFFRVGRYWTPHYKA